MVSTAQMLLLLIPLAACTAAADQSITDLADAKIRAGLVGQWYNDCTMFEFRSDGACGYYVLRAEQRSPKVVRRRLSTYGRWQVHDKKLTFRWHPVKPSDLSAPLLDGSIRFLDSARLEINEPWPGFRRFQRTRMDPCLSPP